MPASGIYSQPERVCPSHWLPITLQRVSPIEPVGKQRGDHQTQGELDYHPMSAEPTIEETGDRMVFLVPSDKNPEVKYRVDCLANGGAMWCSCKDWSVVRQPRLDRGEKPVTARTCCKHATTLIFALIRQRFKEMAQSEEAP